MRQEQQYSQGGLYIYGLFVFNRFFSPSSSCPVFLLSLCFGPSESTDDDKVVAWHWEEVKGPLREEKVSADTQILTLTGLVPGNYTFRYRYLVFSMGMHHLVNSLHIACIFLEVPLSIFSPMGMLYLVFRFYLLLQMFSFIPFHMHTPTSLILSPHFSCR